MHKFTDEELEILKQFKVQEYLEMIEKSSECSNEHFELARMSFLLGFKKGRSSTPPRAEDELLN